MTTHAPSPRSVPLPPAGPAPARRGGRVLLTLVAVLALVVAGWLVGRPEDAELDPSSVGGPGSGDGNLPDEGVTVADVHLAAVARLDPQLLEAVRQATAMAADDGVELRITSGWRSATYQQQLLDEAIATYGEDGARQLVQDPDRSRHVTGDAVDVGPTDAAFWMLRHGSKVGLCQVYANEIWHYELLVAPGGTCPPLRKDAS